MFAPAAALSLPESQVHQLTMLARAGTTTQRVVRRCRVILLAHEGTANNAIAKQLSLSRPTVNAIRAAFLRGGIEGDPTGPEAKAFATGPEQGTGTADSRYHPKDQAA